MGLDFLFMIDCVYRVKSQLKRLARPMYSNPPVHGARIVANVVGNPELFNEWKEEMEHMAGRIKSVRQKLYDSLSAKDKSEKDWSFILKQIGMFSFTGLNKAQVNASAINLSLTSGFLEFFALDHKIEQYLISTTHKVMVFLDHNIKFATHFSYCKLVPDQSVFCC